MVAALCVLGLVKVKRAGSSEMRVVSSSGLVCSLCAGATGSGATSALTGGFSSVFPPILPSVGVFACSVPPACCAWVAARWGVLTGDLCRNRYSDSIQPK